LGVVKREGAESRKGGALQPHRNRRGYTNPARPNGFPEYFAFSVWFAVKTFFGDSGYTQRPIHFPALHFSDIGSLMSEIF
jgi:hypothetical protein